MYGTAWKEERTEGLVTAALAAGFRAIDTANQRKHYYEAGVGKALGVAFAKGLRREQLFLQTKFTFLDGQDRRLPYDPEAPIQDQVAQSFASSLDHLGVERIDSLILHGPSQSAGLGDADHEAWRAMEALVDGGKVGVIGVSNVSAAQLEELVAFARIAPAYVQNRCYAERGWDRAVRGVCGVHGIVYQGFSLLTANRHVLARPDVRAIAARHRRTPQQIVFRFAQHLGMLPLTGTSDPEHMREDLAIADFSLAPDEIEAIEAARVG
jgi:diketogulonate reductase-like aldo/keto reductase